MENKCLHTGHWASAGTMGLTNATAHFVETVLFCTNCGHSKISVTPIELPKSSISKPESLVINRKGKS